jgi:hypothetical protein
MSSRISDELHNKKDDSHNKSNVFIHSASGGIAGAVAKSFIAPLDRTKINFQIKLVRPNIKNSLTLKFMQIVVFFLFFISVNTYNIRLKML